MITRVSVDGFKSLRDFSMDINPGINILLGPNGAGKSNIVQFFEFLSYLVSTDLTEAISKIGGAGSIFSKVDGNAYINHISSRIEGTHLVRGKRIFYEYFFDIHFSPEDNYIYFKNQELKIKICADQDQKSEWDLVLNQSIKENKEAIKPKIDIVKIDKRRFRMPFFLFSENENKNYEENIKDYILTYDPSLRSLMPSIFRLSEYTRNLISDFRGGETINIIPSRVKEPEDAAQPFGIRKDGTGLATTLYHLNKESNFRRLHLSYNIMEVNISPKDGKKVFNRIVKIVKLANESIENINVINDPFTNTLAVKLSINSKDGKVIELPLSSMSDGTIKWITLISALFTRRFIFSIEEPENYLHPWMQAEILEIMRNNFTDIKKESFILMTTHSESLLNKAKPEEVIVVSLLGGKTIAKRISNIDKLKEEISKTGFGLGFYYFANAFHAD